MSDDPLAEAAALLLAEETELRARIDADSDQYARVRAARMILEGRVALPSDKRATGTLIDPERDAVRAVIEERPGVTVTEIASVLRRPDREVAAALASLRRAGEVMPEGRGMKLASRQRLTLEDM